MRQRISGQRPRKFGYGRGYELSSSVDGYGGTARLWWKVVLVLKLVRLSLTPSGLAVQDRHYLPIV